MQTEPGRAQHGYERRNLRIGHAQRGDQQRETRHQQTRGRCDRKTAADSEREERQTPRDENHRLVSVAQRQVPGGVAPQRH